MIMIMLLKRVKIYRVIGKEQFTFNCQSFKYAADFRFHNVFF